MYDWLHYFCGEWEGWALVNRSNHTSWVTAVTPTDRPKSVRNSCVIKVFGGVFMLSRCFLDCSVGVWDFVTGLSQISSFFSRWSLEPFNYFRAHRDEIRCVFAPSLFVYRKDHRNKPSEAERFLLKHILETTSFQMLSRSSEYYRKN